MDESSVADEIELLHPETGVTVVALHGEHDLSTKTEVAALLTAEIAHNRLVIVDVSQAVFIDASLLSNLDLADQTATAQGTRFVLQMGTAPIVRKALEISGLLTRLNVAHTRDEAIGSKTTPLDTRPPGSHRPEALELV